MPNELKWIDTHAHYNHKKFPVRERTEILSEMHKTAEKIINVGTNTRTNAVTMKILDMHDFVYGIVGYFPTDTWELEETLCGRAKENWKTLKNLLKKEKVVAIGEIGLDYNWDKCGTIEGTKARELQKKWFINQIELARELNLPICVHSRDAEKDTLEIFDKYEELNGVIHCYSYGVETAKKCLEKGFYLGVGGTSTYPRNEELREVIKMCPLDKILLETDAPYLSPQPVRRDVNNSSYITHVIDNIAELKGLSREKIIRQTNENAEKLFNFAR